MRARVQIPLRVGIPVVVLSGIVGLAAGVWMPAQNTRQVSAAVKQAPLAMPSDAPQSPVTKQTSPTTPSGAPREASDSLIPSVEDKPEPSPHQHAAPAPNDELQPEPRKSAGATHLEASTADKAEATSAASTAPTSSHSVAETPAAGAETRLQKSPRGERLNRTTRRVESQTATERERPARRDAAAKVQTRDAAPPPPERRRSALSQVPIVGPVFGLFIP